MFQMKFYLKAEWTTCHSILSIKWFNENFRVISLLCALGGTNPNPEAPTTTPLVSPLSGGEGGKTTGPGFCLGSLTDVSAESKANPPN